MAKYIDAERLIAEINNRLMSVNLEELGNFGCHRVWAYNDVKDLITSLQQEHPAKRGYKDCNGCEYNRTLKDQIGWQFRGCFGGDYKGKPIAEIELCPLKVANQQEQEVDLEKEIDVFFYGKNFKRCNDGVRVPGALMRDWQNRNISRSLSTDEIRRFARRFYELGLNARK